MSLAADQLTSFANAEKHLSEQAGPLVARIIQEIEDRYHIKVGEIRMTMNQSEINRSWRGISCVITQADSAPPTRKDPVSPALPTNAQKEINPC